MNKFEGAQKGRPRHFAKEFVNNVVRALRARRAIADETSACFMGRFTSRQKR
jgi:hypothetical protein